MNYYWGRILLFFLIACSLLSCSDCSQDEITRSKSPTGELEAVLTIEDCGGALGSVIYEAYVVISGKSSSYTKKEMVLRVTYFKGYSFHWKDQRILEIEYESGRIYSFVNHVHFSKADKSLEVEVVLKKKY
jgi:hypothetical protein